MFNFLICCLLNRSEDKKKLMFLLEHQEMLEFIEN
jgi:hypothetical protein